MDDAPHDDPPEGPREDLPAEAQPKRRREWWEWLLIVLGIVVLALGGLCVVLIVSLNQMY